ncbi:MAG: DUF1800 domain-containing protein [Chitinophagales bacterium]
MSCATSSLETYIPSSDTPWNVRRVAHLYRRMAFGATAEQINQALNMSPAALVDQLVNQALNLPLSPPPTWAEWARQPVDDYTDFDEEVGQHYEEMSVQWVKDMLNNGFRDKLVLFWSNHFVTEWYSYYCSAYLYSYHKTLQQNALGNFRTFVEAIGKTPAMLIYLNGNLNTANEINENYGRELMELFTLGQNNGYTEDDVYEISRALTGWIGANGETCEFYENDNQRFDPDFHDNSPKEIFGQTGNWGYNDVHQLIFTLRANQVATYICSKIYRYFVNEDIDEEVVAGLAQTFRNNNFELAPVFRQLFKSEHFFHEDVVGTRIKSPMEYLIGFLHTSGLPYNDDNLRDLVYASDGLGQQLFVPVDVAGWPGHHAWINENTLTRRWDMVGEFIENLEEDAYIPMINLALYLTNNSNDVALIARSMVDYFLPNGLPNPNEYEVATDVLKGDIPENYFQDGSWSLDWAEARGQMRLLMGHLLRLPEFQLT